MFRGCLVLILVLFAEAAAASTGGGGSLPWDTWITRVLASFTGPIALIFSVLGFMGCGIALASGAEFSLWVKAVLATCFGVSIIVGAQNIVNMLFGGAVIPAGLVM
ncbi:MAG TPA: TrbC/VirB2 family protein [Anaerolineales bacterium]|jgi:TrbC/VIRB2 family.